MLGREEDEWVSRAGSKHGYDEQSSLSRYLRPRLYTLQCSWELRSLSQPQRLCRYEVPQTGEQEVGLGFSTGSRDRWSSKHKVHKVPVLVSAISCSYMVYYATGGW